MANNQLIQGAAVTGKKFLDIGKAVSDGMGSSDGGQAFVDPTIAKNKAIQASVNNAMGKMKTDMDFTSFSAEETKVMRNFLVDKRSKYAAAAKLAAEFEDTTDPNFMTKTMTENLLKAKVDMMLLSLFKKAVTLGLIFKVSNLHIMKLINLY